MDSTREDRGPEFLRPAPPTAPGAESDPVQLRKSVFRHCRPADSAVEATLESGLFWKALEVGRPINAVRRPAALPPEYADAAGLLPHTCSLQKDLEADGVRPDQITELLIQDFKHRLPRTGEAWINADDASSASRDTLGPRQKNKSNHKRDFRRL